LININDNDAASSNVINMDALTVNNQLSPSIALSYSLDIVLVVAELVCQS
jgi:hypothetical protein